MFDPASGDTHFFDVVAREGLACLTDRALDAAELAAEMARRLDVPLDAALNTYASRLLLQLDDLGLVESLDA